nr:HD domain-containing protein [Maliibacterium massiliense]
MDDTVSKNVRVADFQKGDKCACALLIKQAQVRLSSRNEKYLDATLQDRSGEINAKLWSWGSSPAPDAGSAVFVQGHITEYQGKLQMKVEQLRAARPEEFAWDDLVPSAPLSGEKMYAAVLAIAKSLEDAPLSRLACAMLESDREKLCIWPAALSNHHAERSGLLHHTLSMLRAAEALLPVYPQLNRSLLLCGVIAHDMCKIEEMNITPVGLASEYTARGKMLGHIVCGVERVARLARAAGLDEERSLLMQHMVLSHHGRVEYGSPRVPMFPEAEVLSMLDMLDARMFEMAQALSSTLPGEFTDPVWSLEKRRLYKPVLKKEAPHSASVAE